MCILGFSWLILNIWLIDLDCQDHLATSAPGIPGMVFNVALVFWAKPVKGCYTTQRAIDFFVTIQISEVQTRVIKKAMPFLVETLRVTDKLLSTLRKQNIFDATMVKDIKVCPWVRLISKDYHYF